MNGDTAAALRAVHDAVELLELAVADSEPAPLSLVLVRDRSSGRIHRRVRIEGIPGLLSYESDNADLAGVFDVIPDLATVSDELDLCRRCFGVLDDVLAQDVP